MVLYLIGLGLGDEKDITLRGLEAVRSCSKVYLEAYTSVLGFTMTNVVVVDDNDDNDDNDDDNGFGEMIRSVVNRLEVLYGKKVLLADRELVENRVEELLIEPAEQKENVALLVVGDPVCATTHTDMILRAKKRGVEVRVIHNASVMGAAAGSCGLQPYRFGHTISIPFYEDAWKPTSFYPKIGYNRAGGMHTLCLLDIKVKEPNYQALIKRNHHGTNKFLPPRFMTIPQACNQLMEAQDIVIASDSSKQEAYDPQKTMCVGLARLGQPTQKVVAGTMEQLTGVDFGGPLHSLIICAEDLHEIELEALGEYLVNPPTKQEP